MLYRIWTSVHNFWHDGAEFFLRACATFPQGVGALPTGEAKPSRTTRCGRAWLWAAPRGGLAAHEQRHVLDVVGVREHVHGAAADDSVAFALDE